MDVLKRIATISAITLSAAAPAAAQGTLIGTEAVNERIADIESDVREDLARGEDSDRYSPLGVAQGWNGSLALQTSASSGNTDTGDLSLAGRLTYGLNEWNHTLAFAAEYGESNGVKNQEKAFMTYEGSRYFTPEFYAFGIGRYEYDGFATNEHDVFLGAGPGYRAVNTETFTWRVQGGPGVRYLRTADGSDTTEVAGILSSRAFYKLTDTVSLTNDTDLLGSDTSTLVRNDFGVNFKVTNTLSTRASLRTDYNSDPLPGYKNTDNTIGLALVLGF